MAQKEHKVVRDADEVLREYYEGNETELQEEIAESEEVIMPGDERGSRPKDAARTPTLTGSDMDAGWPYADIGEETVGGSIPTPDQDLVDVLGEAVGVTYQDNEPLKFDEKRDRARWELDPASSDDFQERLQLDNEVKPHGDRHAGSGGDRGR